MDYKIYEKARIKKGYKTDYIFAKKLGEKYGFSQQILNYWKNGKIPKLETQIKIGKALGISPEKIVK